MVLKSQGSICRTLHLQATRINVVGSSLYAAFHATQAYPIRLASVSISLGALVYLIGLWVAVAFGFAPLYVKTPAIYLLLLASVVLVWSVQWTSQKFVGYLAIVRPAFLVSNDEFYAATIRLVRRLSGRPFVPVVLITLTVGVISAIVLEQLGFLDLTGFSFSQPASFPKEWFASANQLGKSIIVGWYLLVFLVASVPTLAFSLALALDWDKAFVDSPLCLSRASLRSGLSLTHTCLWSRHSHLSL